MKQIILAAPNQLTAQDANNTVSCPFTLRGWEAIANEVRVRAPVMKAGVFSYWKIKRYAAPTSGTSVTYTIRKNGVNTALSITLTSGMQEGYIATNVSWAEEEEISVSCVYSGVPGASWITSYLEFDISSDNVSSVYGGMTVNLGAPADLDMSMPFNGTGNWEGAGTNEQYPVPITGRMTKWKVNIPTAPGVGNSVIFTVGKSPGVWQDGSGGTVDTRITISDTNTSGSATFSLPVTAGDWLICRCDYVGTSNKHPAWGAVFEADTPGEFFIGGVADTLGTGTTTQYSNLQPAWEGGVTTTENDQKMIVGPTRLRLGNMYVILNVAPGAGDTRTIRVRKNGANGSQVIVISGTSLDGNYTGAPTIAQYTDLINVSLGATGTPAGANAWFGIALQSLDVVAPVPFRTRIGALRTR